MTFPLPTLREGEVQLIYTSDDIRDDDLLTYYYTSLLTPRRTVSPRPVALCTGAASVFDYTGLGPTRGLVACAVALADAVGVDVEDTSRTEQTFEIAHRYFSKAEVDALCALPAAHRHDCFFDYWTLKEAYVKGRGMGMSLPFDKFTINLSSMCNPTVAAEPEN